MKKQEEQAISTIERSIRRSMAMTVICDLIILAACVVCLLVYMSRNNVNTYNQNVENITNIAASNSVLLRSAMDNAKVQVKTAYNYCNRKTASQILDYLSTVNNPGDYQLLRFDAENSTDLYHVYEGYSTLKQDGKYQEIQYENTSLSYSLYSYAGLEDGSISYSQSFTSQTDAMRYFAVFCSLSVKTDKGYEKYYLVKPESESSVLSHAQNYSQYTDLGLAITYTDGKYMAQDSSFRADNFYDYIYKYNNLSVDEKNELKGIVQNDQDKVGYLEYKDYKRRDCVFAYSICGDDDNWLVIASVPISEFISEKLISFFPLTLIIFLVVLLVFNIYRLLLVVKQLRLSVAREKEASAAKGNFMSRMSHEIRTPLNAVIGYNTIAKNEITEATTEAMRRQAEMKVMDCLIKSEIASKHLLTIINDVLDMSAIESGKISVAHEPFDFKGLITSLTTVFYSQAKQKKVDFKVLFDNFTEEWFIGDQLRTNQILTNLLSNAVKFTPEGGCVTLKITCPKMDKKNLLVHFEVSDTGIGMQKEYLQHIWTPFEQADSSISRRFGGTGLGLSITKNLVDLMNGEISVTSEQGKGSTFYVDLTFERSEERINEGAYDFSTVNALIVDNDKSTCDYISLLFSRCKARSSAVTSGSEAINAIELAKKRGEKFTVCLVDWKMPGMDGIETIKRIKDVSEGDIPIIVLTAYDYTELADKAAEIGVSRFISKPLFQSSLFDLLANIGGVTKQNKKEAPESGFDNQRVLLAEDNAMNMEIAKTIMESAGLIVDCAENGKLALEMFESKPQGSYMAILMDVHMPVMNGHEATKCIRASSHPEAKSIPIIAMTADAFAENVAEAYASGMNEHIAKPIDIPVLFETLKKYRKQ